MFTLTNHDSTSPHAGLLRADWEGMSVATEHPLAEQRHAAEALVAVPCAARPSTGFVHLDGPCHCFAGGPAPEFAPSRQVQRAS